MSELMPVLLALFFVAVAQFVMLLGGTWIDQGRDTDGLTFRVPVHR